jgi:predicted NBD/HSP70 family sugar kinase
MRLWGIDLGGTKISAAAVHFDDPEASPKVRVPTERDRGYDHILKQVEQAVRQLEVLTETSRPPVIGIGTPGTTDPRDGRLKNSNTTVLNGRPFIRDLGSALGVELVPANDANCFALAEASFGAAKGFETVFGIILGTGVGGGLVVHGRVLNGAHGIAGEWGHNLLDPTGNLAYSGRRGVVESVLSGPALERFYAECTGRNAELKDIPRLAELGDLAAIETLRRLVEYFGKAVGPVINLFDPHAIVIGGGVGNLDVLYRDGPTEIAKHVFNPKFEAPVLRPKLGDDAGVYGAALLTNS